MSNPEAAPAGRHRRRHLVYVHGFDLRGPSYYHGLMKSELARYGSIRNRSVDTSPMSPIKAAPRGSATWRMRSLGEGEQITCDVHYLGWQDIVRTKLGVSFAEKLWRGFGALVELIFSGPALAMWRLNWPTGAFMMYPFLAMIALVASGAAPLIYVLSTGAWIWAPVALAVPVAAILISFRVDQRTFFWYLICDLISIRDFAKNRDPAMAERVKEFADFISDILRRTPPEEDIIICSHSSGTFICLSAIDLLFQARPNLAKGRKRKPIVLTLGSAFGYTTFFAGASTADEATRVIERKAVLWADVYAPHDAMCCGALDPARELNGKAEGISRMFFRRTNFKSALAPARYDAIKRSFFHFHFGYLMAATAPDAFDLYHLAIGEEPWASVVRPGQVKRYKASDSK